METPHAKVEVVTVKEGERFPLDWPDQVVSCQPVSLTDKVKGFSVVIVRRGA